MRIDCKYKDTCSGCRHIGVFLDEQHVAKKNHLARLLQQAGVKVAGPIEVVSPGASRDFAIEPT